MIVDPTTGAVSWTPSAADVGTRYITIRGTNYAGSQDLTVGVPTYFASEPRDVAVSAIGSTTATLTWSAPAFIGAPISGYHIKLVYSTGTGRNVRFFTLNFTSTGTDTSFLLAALPPNEHFTLSITAFDELGRDSWNSTSSFATLA